jgi:hypothetical protein
MLQGLATLGTVSLLLAASAAGAAVESSTPDGFVVVNQQVVPVPPAAAWLGLVADVDRWWPRDHSWWGEESTLSIEPRAGGCFCEIAGERQAHHMLVAFVDPPRLLRMTGGLGPLQGMGLHGALDWRLEAVAEGTRLTLRYQAGGYAGMDLRELAPVVDQVQGLQLGALADHLRRSDGQAPVDAETPPRAAPPAEGPTGGAAAEPPPSREAPPR